MNGADLALRPVLDRTAVPGFQRLYALGVIGRPSLRFVEQPRVTLRSQQLRALNLAYALTQAALLPAAARVMVVGGGVAGVTVAAALAYCGRQVTVLERRPGLLPLQAGSTQRWLHPHLIDWPLPGSEQLAAGLPLLNWQAGPAGAVFHQLAAALPQVDNGQSTEGAVFHRLVAAPASCLLEVVGSVHDLQLQPRAGDGATGWEVSYHNRTRHCDAVILAVGFGAEKPFPDLELRSYWDADNLDRDPVSPALRGTHSFISGTGDGGLLDFIRARLYRFDHQDTFRAFLQVAADPALHQALLRLDLAADADASALAAGYDALRVPAAIDEFVQKRLHPQRSATLHGHQRTPYSPNASLLNRFLVSRILRLDGPTGCSRYEMRALLRPIVKRGSRYCVRVEGGGARHEAEFDQVIIRHGTDSALALLPAPIAAACQQLGSRSAAEPDPLRQRLWPDGYFGAEPAPLTALPAPPPSSAWMLPPRVAQLVVPAFQPAPSERISLPTRPSLYRYLCELFANAGELEHFIALHFPELGRQLGSAMTFDQMARLLLADRGVHRVPRERVLATLRQHHPEPAARAEHLLIADHAE